MGYGTHHLQAYDPDVGRSREFTADELLEARGRNCPACRQLPCQCKWGIQMIPGETIASGGNPTCDECGQTPKLDVYYSNAGYYIGTYCKCGPYSRESGYYPTEEKARRAMEKGGYERT